MLVSFFGLSMAAGAVFFCVEGAQLVPVLDLALPRSLPAWGGGEGLNLGDGLAYLGGTLHVARLHGQQLCRRDCKLQSVGL